MKLSQEAYNLIINILDVELTRTSNEEEEQNILNAIVEIETIGTY